MKGSSIKLHRAHFLLAFVICSLVHIRAFAVEQTTEQELLPIGQAVIRLLESGDAERFADEITPSLKDWQAVRSTNVVSKGEDPFGTDFQKQLDRNRKTVETSAQNVLVKAAALGLEPVRMNFSVKEISAKNPGSFRDPKIMAEGESLSWVPEIGIVLVGEPSEATTNAEHLRGDFTLALGGVSGGLKFPAGWRFSDGVRWKKFPSGVADEKTASELVLMDKILSGHRLTLADDPALKILGDVLGRFLKERDENIFVSDAMQSMSDIWIQFENKSKAIGEKLPPKKQFEKMFGTFQNQITQSARAVLDQAERLGISVSNFELKEVVAEDVYSRGAYGSLQEISCGQLRFVFSVKSDAKTKSGRSISGNYILAAGRGQRGPERWTIEDKIRWQEFPKELIGEEDRTEFEFENYVAEHNVLPPGTMTPDVEFIRLDTHAKVKSTSFRGKILVLEFWSTTCGPCQEPLEKLQTFRAKYPDWKDRVEIVTVSIDDKSAEARKHLEERGWTNTVGLWAGPGSWMASSAKAFRLHGIPTAYVIDTDGKVLWAGHPYGDEIAKAVRSRLK